MKTAEMWSPLAWWRPMIAAPKDGRWIEAELEQGTAFAYWTGTYWDDGAGYVVEAKRWRPCDQSLPLRDAAPSSRSKSARPGERTNERSREPVSSDWPGSDQLQRWQDERLHAAPDCCGAWRRIAARCCRCLREHREGARRNPALRPRVRLALGSAHLLA